MLNRIKMKKKMNTKLMPIVFACMLFPLIGCDKDDSKPTTPDSKTPPIGERDPMEVGGAISAVVNGKMVHYPDQLVEVHELDHMVGLTGIVSEQDATHKLKVIVPLESMTGTHGTDSWYDFYVNYEVIPHNGDDSYFYNKNREYEITVDSYEDIKTVGDTTYYRVMGTFTFSGRRASSTETVNVENGTFDMTYKYWY